MNAPDQFRVDPPPSIDAAAYAAALNEVKEIGAIGSLTRTADQSGRCHLLGTAARQRRWPVDPHRDRPVRGSGAQHVGEYTDARATLRSRR